ncbi:NAD(+)/NADH kinase [Leptospira broomii serovar Hurstbridge str. 5399]|uniref:NAD(+)/NADH kinase n=1 Tax=Leptospira broomii serovar Hurstbridge str. 5399 TaxID=1049789 RepID=T0F5G2_9LEPT|nr:NAD(+)/NADH kinase [Leptospira broomii]EQA46365.1 NAD(+)/NADH kinase [Leptospira broomii serovar Hurstbridge str. 5399]
MPLETLQRLRSVLVVIKRTKYELDVETYGSLEEYKRIASLQNNSFDRVYESHIRQVKSREDIKRLFPNATLIFREGLDTIDISAFELVIALGGDNHFTYVAHHTVENLVLGCNSDPATSVGALLSFHVNDIEESLRQNWTDVKIEQWPLINVRIEYPDGRTVKTFQGISEISIRNNSPDLTSRFLISHEGSVEEQKCSGLLVYTGAGSTGWVMSCENRDVSFDKQKPYFKVYCRELRKKENVKYKLDHFTVKESFRLISEMWGGISIDSLAERIYDFPPGAKADFSVSPKRLQVVVKKNG